MNRKSKRSTVLQFRLSAELAEKLEMYCDQLKHQSLSQTCRHFISIGIQSTEMFEKIKNNPSERKLAVKEWEEKIERILKLDVEKENLENLSEEDLETIVLLGFSELERRNRIVQRRLFESHQRKISKQVDPFW